MNEISLADLVDLEVVLTESIDIIQEDKCPARSPQ
jgi:hypothetical protein